MELLPNEIIDQIIVHAVRAAQHGTATLRPRVRGTVSHGELSSKCRLGSPKTTRKTLLPDLATVSKRWQAAAERHTFKYLFFSKNDLDDFEKVMTGLRGSYVRTIRFNILLPHEYDPTQKQDPRTLDLPSNEEFFTDAVTRLLTILANWEKTSPRLGRIKLSFFLRHRATMRTPQDTRGVIGIRHLDPESLPPVSSVVALSTASAWLCNEGSVGQEYMYPYNKLPSIVEYASVVDIAAKLPNLDSVMVDSHSLRPHHIEGTRIESRKEVARALEAAHHLPSVSECVVRFGDSYSIRTDNGETVAYALVPEGESDPVSAALHQMSLHQKSFKACGAVDENLFWPAKSLAPPHWQHLRKMQVEFSRFSPSRQPYFQGRPDTRKIGDAVWERTSTRSLISTAIRDGEEYYGVRKHFFPGSEFAAVPVEENLMPLVLGFANALQCMPNLRSAALYSGVRLARHVEAFNQLKDNGFRDLIVFWGIIYAVPGVRLCDIEKEMTFSDRWFKNDISRRRLAMRTLGWEPEELMETLRETGQDRYGEVLLEHHGGLITPDSTGYLKQ
ncbi:hypothetical protein MKZ38_000679 [Zalerion maritima]|uniref:Uncharacterized protein n=1 Tax=Zalerion maritima TaxID=339359 RepID=A0AAD5RRZ1_9PEZI|nr:hypothetical protein MKZ38_000679 [Zalerion maritima]